MRPFQEFVAVVACTFALSAGVAADVVMTSDGSTIVGKVEQIAGGKLVIVTGIAGRLEIDSSKVIGMSTDGSVHVALTSGDTLVGPVEGSAQGTTVKSRVGDILIPPSEIAMLWQEGTENPQIAMVRQEAKELVEAAKPKWSKKLEGGLTRTEGNTDTLQGHGRLDVKRATKSDMLHMYLAGRYAEQNNLRTTNEYLGGIRYQNTVTEKWYSYARNEIEFDEFEGIDLRATAAAGAGYYWLKKSDHELKTGLGVGFRHESYDSGRTENDAVLDLGLDYRVDIAPWVQFTQSTVYSPDFLEFENYRLTLDSGLLIPFKNDQWALKFGIRNKYNSRPQRGLDRLDNTYYTSIVYSIK